MTTPALGIHDGLRVAAILVGSMLMAALALLRLLTLARLRHALGGLGAALLIGIAC